MNSENLTQNEKISNKLKEVASKISRNDKAEYLKENRLSRATLDVYLTGKFSDIETALGIINWFTGKFQQREKLIAAL